MKKIVSLQRGEICNYEEIDSYFTGSSNVHGYIRRLWK